MARESGEAAVRALPSSAADVATADLMNLDGRHLPGQCIVWRRRCGYRDPWGAGRPPYRSRRCSRAADRLRGHQAL